MAYMEKTKRTVRIAGRMVEIRFEDWKNGPIGGCTAYLTDDSGYEQVINHYNPLQLAQEDYQANYYLAEQEVWRLALKEAKNLLEAK